MLAPRARAISLALSVIPPAPIIYLLHRPMRCDDPVLQEGNHFSTTPNYFVNFRKFSALRTSPFDAASSASTSLSFSPRPRPWPARPHSGRASLIIPPVIVFVSQLVISHSRIMVTCDLPASQPACLPACLPPCPSAPLPSPPSSHLLPSSASSSSRAARARPP